MRPVTYLGPILLALLCVDVLLSWGRTVGWERNTVRNSLKRQAERPDARVIQLGSSTSADWMSPDWLGQRLGRRLGDVVDAHINGCHQPCTWSEVRRLLRDGAHFELAFFGTNLFQQCEYRHTKRVLQDTMLLPAADIPAAFALYMHAQDPLGDMTRFVGMQLSGAYGDTQVFRTHWARVLFGRPSETEAWRWARREKPPEGPVQSCDYSPESIAYKTAVTVALFDDLERLADRTYVMLLPDATLADDDPAMTARWAQHRELHVALVAARPHLTLLDLTTRTDKEGAWLPEHFRDGVHTAGEGRKRQQLLFLRRLKEAGALPRR